MSLEEAMTHITDQLEMWSPQDTDASVAVVRRELADRDRRIESMREEMERLRMELDTSERERHDALHLVTTTQEAYTKLRDQIAGPLGEEAGIADIVSVRKERDDLHAMCRQILEACGATAVRDILGFDSPLRAVQKMARELEAAHLDVVDSAASAMAWQKAGAEAIDLFDPMKRGEGNAYPHILKLVTEAARAAHLDVRDERDALREERMRFINANVELTQELTERQWLTTERLAGLVFDELMKESWGTIEPDLFDMVAQPNEFDADDDKKDDMEALGKVLDRVVARLKDGT